MNKTKKEIIGLIELYMDKTLSNGCLLGDDYYQLGEGKEGDGGWLYYSGIGDDKIYFITIYGEEENRDIGKIIGHYDITAVLKYIYSKGYEWNNYPEVDGILINGEFSYEISDYEFKKIIPNKPLTLYSPDEEFELLNLLLGLK